MNIAEVSVPYRGCSFFNKQIKKNGLKKKKWRFPSLTGVVRFLIQSSKKYIDKYGIRFPSLTGVVRFLMR